MGRGIPIRCSSIEIISSFTLKGDADNRLLAIVNYTMPDISQDRVATCVIGSLVNITLLKITDESGLKNFEI